MTFHPADTIVAVASAPGPGRRAVVRVSGPHALQLASAVGVSDTAFDPGRAQPGASLRLSDIASPLPADIYYWAGPRSATGQDLIEIHTVGSRPLVERLVADLIVAGGRPAGPGEFTLRAFLAGKKDLPQAEAVLGVVEAGSDADLQRALGQMAGGVTAPLAALRDDLLNLLADVEAALDFADEDITFVERPDVIHRLAAGLAHLANLRRQLDDRGVSGRAVRVALVGPPNAGKSSLFNALSGADAALVSEEAGTTRDYLTRSLTLGGVAVELTDTAGWDDPADPVAAQAQRLGRGAAAAADLRVWCVPTGRPFVGEPGGPVLKAATKADLAPATGGTPTSVVAERGLDALRAELIERVTALARPPLAPSLSRCRGHVDGAIGHLRAAHRHALEADPPEVLATALRAALDQIGELAGAVYTPDLLDRIFSRFCIGK
jgi:tRNA modification GTPase